MLLINNFFLKEHLYSQVLYCLPTDYLLLNRPEDFYATRLVFL